MSLVEICIETLAKRPRTISVSMMEVRKLRHVWARVWESMSRQGLDSLESWLLLRVNVPESVPAVYESRVPLGELPGVQSQLEGCRQAIPSHFNKVFRASASTTISSNLLLAVASLGVVELDLSRASWPVYETELRTTILRLKQVLSGSLAKLKALYLPVRGPSELKTLLKPLPIDKLVVIETPVLPSASFKRTSKPRPMHSSPTIVFVPPDFSEEIYHQAKRYTIRRRTVPG